MGPWGRGARLLITGALVSLTVLGTVRGVDDDFPFGPLRMYATAHRPDAPVDDTWPWARDERGREILLDQTAMGIRRAEIEGQLPSFVRQPTRLRLLADAYEARNHGAPRIESVEIRTRRILMHQGKPTGRVHVVVRARWTR